MWLRIELRGEMDLRVSLLKAQTQEIVADAVSNLGIVDLSFDGLLGDQAYLLKYEFFDKDLMADLDSQSQPHSHSCLRPHFAQQLAVQSLSLRSQRVYLPSNDSPDLNQFSNICHLSTL